MHADVRQVCGEGQIQHIELWVGNSLRTAQREWLVSLQYPHDHHHVSWQHLFEHWRW